MDKLIITNASSQHINDILEIETKSFQSPWSRESFISEISTNKLATYIVAKLNGKIVGYAGMWCVFEEGHITNIAVHPEARGKKIGTQMIEALIDLAKKNDIEQLFLEVRKSNYFAQKLYKKFGFENLGFRKKYYDDKEDALIMLKVV